MQPAAIIANQVAHLCGVGIQTWILGLMSRSRICLLQDYRTGHEYISVVIRRVDNIDVGVSRASSELKFP